MHGRMARSSYTGDAHDLARQAEKGMLLIFEAQPGFKAYSLIASEDEVISYSAWDTNEQAEAAKAAAKDWMPRTCPAHSSSRRLARARS